MIAQHSDINEFFVAGINYKKTDAILRGQFSINANQYSSILEIAASIGLQEIFILSTCNRTEIYGLTTNANDLIKLLCSQTEGTVKTFNEICYIKKGKAAVEHLFFVASGLDSQILGDYEIVGQIKQAIKFVKGKKIIGTFLERLTNNVLQCSKAIKNNTELSNGTVSVAFAAIQYLKENIFDIQTKKILLIGTGKIGRNTCKNLIDYLKVADITLINRTEEKALEIAQALNLSVTSFKNMSIELQQADVIIVATGSSEFILKKSHLISNYHKKILIDFSIPNNIDPEVKQLNNVILLNVDDLSKINDETLKQRVSEIPKAKKLIAQYMNEFFEWCDMRKNIPALKALKQKLVDMDECNLFSEMNSEINGYNKDSSIQKVVNNTAVKMRTQFKPGCNYIEAINDFISSRSIN
ncbi:MAG: glutamyl-tRNA reductase [Chitinophagaceae bacterium]